jgi:hypothetical protein
LPVALQQQVYETVEQTRERSGWPAKRTLAALGIARRTYYRWLKEEKWARQLPETLVRPVQPYEALPEERQAVLDYALRHGELRHRELAWRMVDEDVACLSPSTVYRILKELNLVCPWRRRRKRRREEDEKATRPKEIWATDLMYVQVAYFFVNFLDEYSRYVVHHELLLGMDGVTVSLAAQAAIDTLPRARWSADRQAANPLGQRELVTSRRNSKVVLQENGLSHCASGRTVPRRTAYWHGPTGPFVSSKRGRAEESAAGPSGVSPNHPQIQRGAIARRVGLFAAVDYNRGNPAARFEARVA